MQGAIRLSVGAVALAWLVFPAAAVGAPTASNPPGTFHGCPRQASPLPLAAAVYAPAARRATLRFVHAGYLKLARANGWDARVAGARPTRVLLVRRWLPSGWIRRECGLAVWGRSIAVAVYFPAMDLPHNPVGRCNDCARVTFLLSRTARGWTVWGNV